MGGLKLKHSRAETNMSIGVQLRTQIVDVSGAPTGVVVTGGALRAHAANLGIISFQVQMFTKVVGNGVTDFRNSGEWSVTLLLPGSSGAKGESQEDTELIVAKPNRNVAFHTVCRLEHLISNPLSPVGAGHYQSLPLDVFGTTS
jgi:hypothetical protein